VSSKAMIRDQATVVLQDIDSTPSPQQVDFAAFP
jgi:hypothetical protein